jgi:hypothetical protein
LGTVGTTKWLPFDPPPASDPKTGNIQLDGLIGKLTDSHQKDGNYLLGFADMINGCIQNMPYPPSDYAQFANAIVGKPLALVNVGFSLELAAPAITAQNTLGERPVNEEEDLASYEFPIKIGDFERPFDGVLGYYNAYEMGTPKYGQTDLTELFSYFVRTPLTDQNAKITPIDPPNFPILKPWYIHPESLDDMLTARTLKLQIKTLIIDPYTPMHVYSPILPVKALSLPKWTIQSAFKGMTAFFRLGPYLTSRDVPVQYDSTSPIYPDTWATPKTAADVTTAQANANPMPVRLPVAGKKGLWNWLQPYDVLPDPAPVNGTPTPSGKATAGADAKAKSDAEAEAKAKAKARVALAPTSAPAPAKPTPQPATITPAPTQPKPQAPSPSQQPVAAPGPSKPKDTPPQPPARVTLFNAFEVDEEDTNLRYDPGPYTFIEGYLQLAAPLIVDQNASS